MTTRGAPNREPPATRRLERDRVLRVVVVTHGAPIPTSLLNRLRRRAAVIEIRADRVLRAEIEASLRVADAIFAPATTLSLLDGLDLAGVASAPIVCIAFDRRDAVTAYAAGAVYCVLASATDLDVRKALARVQARREVMLMASLRRSVARIARAELSGAGDQRERRGLLLPQRYATRIHLPTQRGITVLHLRDVEAIVTRGGALEMWANSAWYRKRQRLRDLASSLDPQRFVQIHRACVVNMDHVSAVIPRVGTGDGIVVLKSGARFRYTRIYRPALLRSR